MKIIRKIFINKRNGQASLTLPKEVIEKLTNNNTLKIPKKISLEIINPKDISRGRHKRS